MAREFAKAFYNSAAWRKTSRAFAASKFYTCERCGRPGSIVHHKKKLTPSNIGDVDVSLNWNNFMLLCQECHNAIHAQQSERKPVFDEQGNLIGVKENTPLCLSEKSS